MLNIMMIRVMERLIGKGYQVEIKKIFKNGIESENLVMINREKNMSPTFTPEFFNDFETVDEAVEKMIEIYNQDAPFNSEKIINDICNKEYLLTNIRMAIQHETEEEIVKRVSKYSGLEEYLYIKISDEGTIKLHNNLIDTIKCNIEELWGAAYINTRKEIETMDIAEIVGLPSETPMTIVTNCDKHKGAVGIIYDDVLEKIANDMNVNELVILPSSVHECIVVPKDGNLNEYLYMVQAINGDYVAPVDKLADSVFTWNR